MHRGGERCGHAVEVVALHFVAWCDAPTPHPVRDGGGRCWRGHHPELDGTTSTPERAVAVLERELRVVGSMTEMVRSMPENPLGRERERREAPPLVRGGEVDPRWCCRCSVHRSEEEERWAVNVELHARGTSRHVTTHACACGNRRWNGSISCGVNA
uniref:Uncharacterized protein n=1 Tax=Oryza sativa subsp. japonica TaxID=39947 RepID=Q69VQ5_ORYSJ|nr:hypothetical protein [Oryza sativa Japonica Group]